MMLQGFTDRDPFEVGLLRLKEAHRREIGVLRGAVSNLEGLVAEYEAKFRKIHASMVCAAIDEPEMAGVMSAVAKEVDDILHSLPGSARDRAVSNDGSCTSDKSTSRSMLSRSALTAALAGRSTGAVEIDSRRPSASSPSASSTPRWEQPPRTVSPGGIFLAGLGGPRGDPSRRLEGLASKATPPRHATPPRQITPRGTPPRPPAVPPARQPRSPKESPRQLTNGAACGAERSEASKASSRRASTAGEDGAEPPPRVVGNSLPTEPWAPQVEVGTAMFVSMRPDQHEPRVSDSLSDRAVREESTEKGAHEAATENQCAPLLDEAPSRGDGRDDGASSVPRHCNASVRSVGSQLNRKTNVSGGTGKTTVYSLDGNARPRSDRPSVGMDEANAPPRPRTSAGMDVDLHAKLIQKEIEKDKAEIASILRKPKKHRLKKLLSSEEDKTWLNRIVDNPKFDLLCALMILANSALIGAEVEHLTTSDVENPGMQAFGYACSGFFLCELILRILNHGWRDFFTNEEWKWNIFDAVLVCLSIIDIVVVNMWNSEGGQDNASSISTSLKTVKMLRIVRMGRVFRFFSELSQLALMIIDSIKSLTWALLMLVIINFTFAVVFTFYVTEWLKEMGLVATLEGPGLYFSSLLLSMYTLFHSMLNGISWHLVADSLREAGLIELCLLFVVYMAFTMLAVLNIITGVFVDRAVETAKTQREFLVQKEMELKEKWLAEMRSLFEEMDTDGSGTVNLDEVSSFFSDPRVQSYFQALGLDATDAQRLFTLLDEYERGEVEVKEFLDGCLRLKGAARSIDVYALMWEHKKFTRTLDKKFEDLGDIMVAVPLQKSIGV